MAHGLGMPMLGSALNEWRCYFEFLERSQMVSRNPKTFTLRKVYGFDNVLEAFKIRVMGML